MIGNDIVDLNLAAMQSNWRRTGFLNKIFTQTERTIILDSKNPFLMVWLLWSMKESAYKVHVQQHSKRFFAPQKFECILKTLTEGIVIFDENEYKTISQFTDDYIYSIAFVKGGKNVENVCFKFDTINIKNQRIETYRRLKLAVSNKHRIAIHDVEVKKTPLGIPLLYYKNKVLLQSFSLTHHGNHGAISLLN